MNHGLVTNSLHYQCATSSRCWRNNPARASFCQERKQWSTNRNDPACGQYQLTEHIECTVMCCRTSSVRLNGTLHRCRKGRPAKHNACARASSDHAWAGLFIRRSGLCCVQLLSQRAQRWIYTSDSVWLCTLALGVPALASLLPVQHHGLQPRWCRRASAVVWATARASTSWCSTGAEGGALDCQAEWDCTLCCDPGLVQELFDDISKSQRAALKDKLDDKDTQTIFPTPRYARWSCQWLH